MLSTFRALFSPNENKNLPKSTIFAHRKYCAAKNEKNQVEQTILALPKAADPSLSKLDEKLWTDLGKQSKEILKLKVPICPKNRRYCNCVRERRTTHSPKNCCFRFIQTKYIIFWTKNGWKSMYTHIILFIFIHV